MKRIKPIYQLLVFIGYFGFSFFIQKDTINEFPHHIHAWAHTDHYALSKGFLNNNFDLFHPETLTSNKQFPSENHPNELSKVTSSDFPFVQYTAALIMKTTGNEQPIIYRVLMLLLSSLGLLYLFRIAYQISSNALFSLLLPILLLFSPLYLDYQIGFLPSVAAMSFLFAGSFYYLRYKLQASQKDLVLSVLCLSLSAAVRTPFAIPLIALIGHHILLLLFKKDSLKPVLILSLGLMLPIAYFLYNQYLRAEYGSIFLGSPLYARNFVELESNWMEACENWFFHYYGVLQWMFVLIPVFMIAAINLLKQSVNHTYQVLTQLTVLYGIGVLLYLVLMSRQLVHHDYYALDTFIPFLTLVGVVSISEWVKTQRIPHFSSIFILGCLILTINDNLSTLSERRQPESSEPYTSMYKDYSNLGNLLVRNGISKDEQLLVLDSFAPNMPFLLSGYHGANVLDFGKHSFQEVMNWPIDHIILRDDLLYQDFWEINERLLQETEVVDYGFGIFLLRKSKNKGESLFHWLNIDPNTPITTKNYTSTDLEANEGASNKEFTATFRDTLFNHDYRMISLSFELKKKQSSEALWHIHIHSETEELFNEYLQIPSMTTTLNKKIILPNDLNTWYISSYLYNPNNNVIDYQNFEVKYY
ncbi:hypothetical protein [Parvicella tangerina]|uniref:Glycosyltransferase RgtA/B/C/D-like domain-containing protein n=1 Tax=Parvicella tangerina TaxID=2829795 RepID=A0A916NAK2_9FLAO|nr:hypothetical protein [Parvicella tangerina]CAG5080891.1 hypothetical protein CRYO30217_01472 [Parvicella tangerina]